MAISTMHGLASRVINKRQHKVIDDSTPHNQTHHSPRMSRRNSIRSTRTSLLHLQNDMPSVMRIFSRIVHIPVVESITDAMSSTIARPIPLIMGAIASILVTITLYVVAKKYGYVLTGFEPVASYALGWSIGCIIDYAKALSRGRWS